MVSLNAVGDGNDSAITELGADHFLHSFIRGKWRQRVGADLPFIIEEWKQSKAVCAETVFSDALISYR